MPFVWNGLRLGLWNTDNHERDCVRVSTMGMMYQTLTERRVNIMQSSFELGRKCNTLTYPTMSSANRLM